ncbi:DUF4127 family protein [Deinococcus rhizophilus]|uniref:DUF4127 family protein n=1 Tax=Deinococcus rhizophilus TaxID=3049544 RepID=UPI003898FE11
MPRRLPLLAHLALLLAAQAGAQTLLPLDSRPATRVLPALIAGLRGGEVRVPPAELLGTAARGADPAALTGWLEAQPPRPAFCPP